MAAEPLSSIDRAVMEADDLVSLLNRVDAFPCSDVRQGWESCWAQQGDKGRPLPQFNPAEMCLSCGASWHAGQALYMLYRLQAIQKQNT